MMRAGDQDGGRSSSNMSTAAAAAAAAATSGARRRHVANPGGVVPSSPSPPPQIPIPLHTVPLGTPVINAQGWSELPEGVKSARRMSWEALRQRSWDLPGEDQ